MAYHVYHTEAIVLESRPFGEGDRLLHLYTRELGLVMAHAKSLREMRSRLRYALTTFSHAEVDLIYGKHGWKIISARPVDSLASIWRRKEKRSIIAQHAQLLRRLIQGEERHEALFDETLSALAFLQQREGVETLRSAELLFVVRLLSRLGYWEDLKEFESLFVGSVWEDDVAIALVETSRTSLLRAANRALRETQL